MSPNKSFISSLSAVIFLSRLYSFIFRRKIGISLNLEVIRWLFRAELILDTTNSIDNADIVARNYITAFSKLPYRLVNYYRLGFSTISIDRSSKISITDFIEQDLL